MPPASLFAARRHCTCLLTNSAKPLPRRAAADPLAAQSPRRTPLATCRFFGASPRLGLDVEATKRKNHYERLGVRHDASPADIKRSFYRLSKTHHPDANRTDPSAADRFSLLSESYTLLSDPKRRSAYDRDVLRLHTQHSSHSNHPRGSYSSSQAGGRSPSGLSRRRTTFRGPPPSFYRSGGWGAQGDKRRKAHEESTNYNSSNTSNPSSEQHQQQQQQQQQHPGTGPGSDPFHDTDPYTPHFDRASHRRTHEREDVRRGARIREKAKRAWGDDNVEFEPQTSLAGHFAIVSAILAATFLGPFLWMQIMGSKRTKRAERGG